MRQFVPTLIVTALSLLAAQAGPAADEAAVPRVAALVSCWHHNAHADLIAGRLLETHTLDGRGRRPRLELASLYVDQFPDNDKSRRLAAAHGVPIYATLAEALELGTGRLAVDGVLIVAEHGVYPASDTGQTVYPKRRMFDEVVAVFQRSGRAVPVFIDKHLADNWEDARSIYDTAARLKVPLMAGSVLPGGYRRPAVDVPRDARLREIVALSFHTLDAYGFHAVEAVQALAERRAGGETGVRSVRCLTGEPAWQSLEDGSVDRELFDAAYRRVEWRPYANQTLREAVAEPVLFRIEYADGLRTSIYTLNYAVGNWTAAWRDADGNLESTLFWTQEERPLAHFTPLVDAVAEFVRTGQAPWPVERTLLTSGTLDALLISKRDDCRRLETPWLDVSYRSDWNWSEPEPAPSGRPLDEQ